MKDAHIDSPPAFPEDIKCQEQIIAYFRRIEALAVGAAGVGQESAEMVRVVGSVLVALVEILSRDASINRGELVELAASACDEPTARRIRDIFARAGTLRQSSIQ